MTELTLGISPCPNDVFIFSGILLDAVPPGEVVFRVDYQDVETLNGMARAGALDVAKISYANYPLCRGEYDLLDSGGALGRGVGPLLLVNGAAWNPDAEVLIPGEYTTANFLLDFFARRPLRKRVLPFDALYDHLLQTPGAQGVVIHEKRFTYERDGLTLVQDLGTVWEQETGHPIPLGAILARRSLSLTAQIDGAIRRSLDWAYAHPDDAFALCRQHAADLRDEVIQAHIDLYVNEYSKTLGPEGRAAIAYFFAQAEGARPTPVGG